MHTRPSVPPEPPREVVLKDGRGQVWAAVGEYDQWERVGADGPGTPVSWPELLAVYGPVDVMVWSATIAASETENGQAAQE